MFGSQFPWPQYGPSTSGIPDPQELLAGTFGINGENISPLDMAKASDTAQNVTGGGAAPAVQQTPLLNSSGGSGPTVIKKSNKPAPSGGGGMSLPGMPSGMLSNIPGLGGGSGGGGGIFGGGGLFGGGGASAGSGGSGMFSGLSSMFSNPWTAIPAAAVVGAGSLSADSAAAGNGAQVENWMGPLYNIPEAISRGDWDDVMKDGALGPVGAIYGIASGKDPLKSIANSFGPLGQIPYLLGKGEMPYSGGKTSKHFMSAFQGRGV